MTRQPFTLKTAHGPTLHGVAHLPERPGLRPAVVLCHGFKGFMEWGFHPPLADLLAERGFVAVRFNFSGAGMLPGDELVTDPEAFKNALFSRDVDDVLAVLDAVGTRIAPNHADPERLGLVGHSRGGGTAVLAAAHEAARGRLGALVTWAAVASNLERFGPTREAWREKGALPIANARTKQQLEIDVAVLDELEARGDGLVALAQAPAVEVPWLIVHGENDEAVPVTDARRLAAAATATHELLLIPDTGHTFGAQHPFAGPTPPLIQVMNATQTWLKRHLG